LQHWRQRLLAEPHQVDWRPLLERSCQSDFRLIYCGPCSCKIRCVGRIVIRGRCTIGVKSHYIEWARRDGHSYGDGCDSNLPFSRANDSAFTRWCSRRWGLESDVYRGAERGCKAGSEEQGLTECLVSPPRCEDVRGRALQALVRGGYGLWADVGPDDAI